MITLFYFLVLIFSVVIHEVSHGLSAKAQGDTTAEDAGRLTLNPLKHLDPIGSILLPGFLYFTGSRILFGWARPVPFNPYNLRDQRWGPALVALAGPASNVTLALLFSMIFRLATTAYPAALPFLSAIIYLNIVLAVFNLVPIPPLDGSRLLEAFLGDEWAGVNRWLEVYGLFFLILFIIFGFPLLQPLFPKLLQLLAGSQSLGALLQFLKLL